MSSLPSCVSWVYLSRLLHVKVLCQFSGCLFQSQAWQGPTDVKRGHSNRLHIAMLSALGEGTKVAVVAARCFAGRMVAHDGHLCIPDEVRQSKQHLIMWKF